ncbi:LuxR C-terminal-related transcriptional regulator [Paenibacillus agaridevorans]|uniref:LuxR C-terminal-related transcriptional regulator n=1 Tax=Paenibacillus agaridevorans TaxID=171404 RepID=UPI001BE45DAD|nr:LuxR C-terminal-related transcriptional regulator [Paenibacillus agaridevorans]
MTVMHDRAALAKITLPTRRGRFVTRERLLQTLNRSLAGKLTIVCAPAGYGKTSLLAEWGIQAGRPVAWLSLDGADNDSNRFWRCLTHALAASVDDPAADRLYLLAEGMNSVSRLTYIDALLNELALVSLPLLFIIDDYHAITSEQLHEHIAYFIQYMPDNLHLAIASRQPIPFPTMKLMISGEAAELTVSELRFTLEETELLLCDSVPAPVECLIELLDRTEGWITGMMLVRVMLRSGQTMEHALRSFKGHERHVSDYLFQEAVASLPIELKDFLLRTSLLTNFDASYCNEVTGRDDGDVMLEQIHELNLFLLPIGERSGYFRYHRLFSEFLAETFRMEHPEEWRRTHGRASVLFARHGMLHEAIDHASFAGEYDKMEELLGRHIPYVLRRGELVTLLRWFGNFPDDYSLSHEMSLLHAFALVLTGQLAPAEHLLQRLERALEQAGGLQSENNADLKSGILFVRSNLVFISGDYERWLAYSTGILDELVPENPLFYNFNYNLKEPFVRRTVMGMNGVLSPTTETMAELFSGTLDSHGWDRSLINLYVKQSLAEGYYEWNRLKDSLSLLRGIEQAVASRGIPGLLIPHRLTEASIHKALGDIAQAEQVVKDALRFASGLEDKHWLIAVYAYRTRLELSIGSLSQAKDTAKHMSVTAKELPIYAKEYEYLTLARLLGRQRKEKEALRLLDLLKPQARREGQLSSLVEHAVLHALFEYKVGNRNSAFASLEEALIIGAENGYIRSFADEGAEMTELLHRYKEYAVAQGRVNYPRRGRKNSGDALPGVTGSYLDELIAACPAPVIPQVKKGRASKEPLTSSELELLRQLRKGASNKQISAALHLSEGTVKVYLSTLYGKLGVSSRTQALIAAQERKLL